MITQENMLGKLNHYGNDIIVNKQKTKEIIGDFEIISIIDLESCNLDEEQKFYVTTKIKKYKNSINRLINKLKEDRNTRQAVLQFDADFGLQPECICSIQYLIRNDELYIIMFSRSMNINMLQQDIYIAYNVAKLIKNKIKNIKKIEYMKLLVGSLHLYKNDNKNNK